MSVYDVFVSDWIDVFGRDKILIIRHEDYVENRIALMRKVYSFLDLGAY